MLAVGLTGGCEGTLLYSRAVSGASDPLLAKIVRGRLNLPDLGHRRFA